jgi:hypothetical protein
MNSCHYESTDFHGPVDGIRFRHDALWLLLCVWTVGLLGCSKQGPDIFQVSGKITRGGQPVADLIVHFVPAQGRPSWGQTDNEGHYELHYVAKRMGAVTGAHRVFVTKRENPDAAGLLPGQSAPLSAVQRAIFSRYGTLEASPLTSKVEHDRQVIDFALD